jgi:2-dehydro-3-deoxygluconokinase
LPSIEDLQGIFGEQHDADGWIGKLTALGAKDIVLKNGGCNVFTRVGGQRKDFALDSVARVVDTTGAGDSFNAGYLAGRTLGQAVQQAVIQGHALASLVIQHPGAIMPVNSMR